MNDLKKFFTTEIENTYYGKIIFRCIGLIDLDALKENNQLKLIDKYNPIEYFKIGTLSMETLEYSQKHRMDTSWSVSIALPEDNINWKPNQNSPYYSFWVKNKKTLPFTSKKTVLNAMEWQDASNGLFTPDYLNNVQNIDDLKKIYADIKGINNTNNISHFVL
jgi:hypothetical protein